MARFGDLSDTDPKVMELFIRLHREKPLPEKAAMALQMLSASMSLAEAGVRLHYPRAGAREVRLRAAARLYGNELIQRALGWDPETASGPNDRV